MTGSTITRPWLGFTGRLPFFIGFFCAGLVLLFVYGFFAWASAGFFYGFFLDYYFLECSMMMDYFLYRFKLGSLDFGYWWIWVYIYF